MTTESAADVAVVGLGAFGSAVLYQLARRGIAAIGVDRYDPPHAMGSSHGETRITRLAVGEGEAYAPFVRRSHEIWRALERESGETLMVQTGGLILAPGSGAARHHGREDFVRRSLTMAERLGIEHERLDAAEVGARFPQFALRGDEIGYFEPGAGYLVPEACVRAQLTLALTHGARVRRQETVLAVQQEGGGVRLVTDQGVIRAGHAVVTAGAWAAGLLQAPLRPLSRVYRQTLHWFEAANPAAFAAGRAPIFIWMHGDGEEDYFYGFPTPPGGVGVKMASERFARTVDPDTFERTVDAAESAAIYARHVQGRLVGVTPHALRAAACLYTVTPDYGFLIDQIPDEPGITVISACSGHGFKHSAAIGEAVAMQLGSEAGGLDLAPFGLRRFG